MDGKQETGNRTEPKVRKAKIKEDAQGDPGGTFTCRYCPGL